jgi:acetyl esterase/lipase
MAYKIVFLCLISCLIPMAPSQVLPDTNNLLAQSTSPKIVQERDVVYSTVDGKELRLDLAYPQIKSEKPLPAVVWIHGGAWLEGNKNDNEAAFLAQRGYFTASIDYRLSQEAIWPAQIFDCKAAIRFLRAHAQKYNLDPQKIGVWGSSAGGHLVAMLGTSGDVKEFEGTGGWPKESSRVQAVVDFYGPTHFIKMCDFPSSFDHSTPDSPESKLIGGAVKDNPDKVRSVDPITYVTPGDPPFLIVHGDKDDTVPYNQSELLNAALKTAGVNVQFITVKGGGHGGWNEKTQPTNSEVTDLVVKFFDKILK